MNNFLIICFTAVAVLFNSCTSKQTQDLSTSLSANEFSQKLNELPAAPVIDVRTPAEYSKGHLINARNIDWNGSSFENQIKELDKSKPVFVYCLSGGRSSAAAVRMRSEGFKEVYELKGGIMKWKSADLPLTTVNADMSKGMTRQQFDDLLSSDKLVLVDIYADWCEPCKVMKPYLDDISKELNNKVTVIRINADDNRALCTELNIDALPDLQLYKNKTLVWNNTGYIDKAAIIKTIQTN